MNPYKKYILFVILVLVCFITMNIGAQILDPETGEEIASKKELMKWKIVMEKPLKIGKISVNRPAVRQGEKFEITFGLEATYDNPFDYEDIDVQCRITGPDGNTINAPAFFYTEFTGEAADDNLKQGDAVWKARFTPLKTGNYKFVIIARDRNKSLKSEAVNMQCIPGEYRGFIRASKIRPSTFEFNNGRPYLPIGLNNVEWSTTYNRGISPAAKPDMMERMKRLSDNGGTFIRYRFDFWFYPIESIAGGPSRFLGPGYFHQQASRDIDQIYEKAEELGIYIMHCFYNANSIAELHPDFAKLEWRRKSAYSLKKNGGPLDKIDDFWINEKMKKLSKRLFRYSIARWGYSKNMMAWEFMNEYNTEPMVEEKSAWYREMSDYLKSMDIYGHLVTTSQVWDKTTAKGVWTLPNMDIVQAHLYDNDERLPGIVKQNLSLWNKPFCFGEYGMDWAKSKSDYDPEGVHFHNSLWSVPMSGGMGAFFWFCEKYLDPNNLYYHYMNFSKWAQDIVWNDPGMRLLDGNCEHDPSKGEAKAMKDYVRISTGPINFGIADESRFFIDPYRVTVSNFTHLQPMIHMKKNRKTKPIFIFDCKEPAKFKVFIKSSTGNDENRLIVFLDGKSYGDFPFPAGKKYGIGKSEYMAKWDTWCSIYNQGVEIDIPAGKHEVMLEAVGKDRFDVDYFVANYAQQKYPLEILGQQAPDRVFFWIRNRQSSGGNLRSGIKPGKVEDVIVTINGLNDGRYNIEWYDTWKGVVLNKTEASSKKGKMVFSVPPVLKDVAGKVVPLK